MLQSVELNIDGFSVSSLFDEAEGLKFVKYGSDHILLDGRHRQNAMQVLQVEGSYPGPTATSG